MKTLGIVLVGLIVICTTQGASINYSSESSTGNGYVFTGTMGTVVTLPGVVTSFDIGTLLVTFVDPLPIEFMFSTNWTREGFTEPLVFSVDILDFAGGYFVAIPHFTNPNKTVMFGIRQVPGGLANEDAVAIPMTVHDVPEPMGFGLIGTSLLMMGLLLRNYRRRLYEDTVAIRVNDGDGGTRGDY